MGSCYNSIIVDAPVDKVWAALRDFHDLSFASGVITRVEAVGDKPGDAVGAQRVLNDAFAETLLELDDENKMFRYSIDDGPGPVASDLVESYEGRAQAFPVTATNQTFVLWASEYTTSDDEAVGEFCNPIYQALLGALADHFKAA